MGQQQILLIILGVIIVGIAIVVSIALFQDNSVDHDRAAVIGDLKKLSSKALAYYSKPTTLGGGGRTFLGLTADAVGMAQISITSFSNNQNGMYSIKTAGSLTSIVFEGVGKAALSNGTFPTYDMTVTASAQTLEKLN